MKVLMINVVCGTGSTGRICTDIAVELDKQGYDVKIAYGRGKIPEQFKKYSVRIGSNLDVVLHGVKARLLDGMGFGSKKATEQFIRWVKEYDPDVIHLHNIHGYFINVEILFDYLRTCGKKILWTLHDCWSFTGHCAYFDYVGCDKWKSDCHNCQQKKEYPARFGLDMSRYNYTVKRTLFTKIPNMTLVTPSDWLSELISESYLSEYDVVVINNGVDTSVFKPNENNIKEKYNCINKKVVLGVASTWDKRKGLDIFIELAKILNPSYQLILVGLSKKQIMNLPDNVIGIERTDSVYELASLYASAYVFVNPTLEDNYPTTNIEAISCGTPVITFSTGGSPESAQKYGLVVQEKKADELAKAIENFGGLLRENITFDKKQMIHEYLLLYEKQIDSISSGGLS